MSRACVVLLISAGALSCGVETDDSRGAHRLDPIVGGQPDDDGAFPAALGLSIGFTTDAGVPRPSGCSGVLIRPDVVLTAAHCLNEAAFPGLELRAIRATTESRFPASLSDPGWVLAKRWVRHPNWVPNPTYVFDVGLIELAQPITNVAPVPIAFRALRNEDVGTPMKVVGHGRTTATSPTAGTRYVVDLTIRGLTDDSISLGTLNVAGVCAGDSGGPSFVVDPDGVRRVIGIHSYTFNQSNCTNGLDARLDIHADFIRAVLTDAGTATCAEDGTCVAGCAQPDPDCACARDGVCDERCGYVRNDPDCPLGCERDGFCQRLPCPTIDADPDCTAELQACQSAPQCASRLCVSNGQEQTYCARACSDGCDEATMCVNGACVFPPPIASPAFTQLEATASRGCSLAPNGVALLGLLVALRRRAPR